MEQRVQIARAGAADRAYPKREQKERAPCQEPSPGTGLTHPGLFQQQVRHLQPASGIPEVKVVWPYFFFFAVVFLAGFFFILVLVFGLDFAAVVFFLTGIDTSFTFVAAGQASETFRRAQFGLYLRANYKNAPGPKQ